MDFADHPAMICPRLPFLLWTHLGPKRLLRGPTKIVDQSWTQPNEAGRICVTGV
jgi:hypothetical protein